MRSGWAPEATPEPMSFLKKPMFVPGVHFGLILGARGPFRCPFASDLRASGQARRQAFRQRRNEKAMRHRLDASELASENANIATLSSNIVIVKFKGLNVLKV